MRLDKFLSNATDFSRKDIRRLARLGLIEVNGSVTKDPARHVDVSDEVRCDGVVIGAPQPRYFMMHKPTGVVSVTRDSEHPTVLDLLDEPRPETLQIAGRLDLDTTGLLLITDDGAWNHRITSPRSRCVKSYRAELAEAIDPAVATRFAQGVWLDGEKRRTLPAELRILSPCEVELDIQEGKYHQVKRMFAAIGNRVVALHRVVVGHLRLDEELAPGDYRPLTPAEIAGFEEPSAYKEPSAGKEPSADKEPLADKEPSANKEPSAGKAPPPPPAPDLPAEPTPTSDEPALRSPRKRRRG